MLRKLLLYFSAVLFVMGTISVVLAFEVPEKVILERPQGNEKLNSWVTKVTFPHGFHAIRVPCQKCHHMETDKSLGKYIPCRQCHRDVDPKEPTSFYRAWHTEGPPSCLGCHTQMRYKGGKNPIGCTTACHKPG